MEKDNEKENSKSNNSSENVEDLWGAPDKAFRPAYDNYFLNKLRKIVDETPNLNFGRLLYLMGSMNYKSLFSAKGDFPSSDKPAPLKLATIAKLHFILRDQIDLNDFLLKEYKDKGEDKDAEAEWFDGKSVKRTNYFTRSYWNRLQEVLPVPEPNSLIDVRIVKPYTSTHDLQDSEPLEVIYEDTKQYFLDAKKSIKILHTLYKGNNMSPGEYQDKYGEAQKIIFRAIEDVLSKKDIEYVRIFSLSPSERIFTKDLNDIRKNFHRAFASEISSHCLSHVQWCLENYPKKCQFYIIPQSYYRHLIEIDEETSIVEDYIKDAQKNLVYPRCIIIHDIAANKKTNKWKTSIWSNINNEYLSSTKNVSIRLETSTSLQNIIVKSQKYLEKQTQLRKAVKDKILTDLDQIEQQILFLEDKGEKEDFASNAKNKILEEGLNDLFNQYSKDLSIFAGLLKMTYNKLEELR